MDKSGDNQAPEKLVSTGIQRRSNLELLRILSFLLIVAHHYVVNSGITAYYDFSSITGNMLFLQLYGMWGRTTINCFILISGYFMCTKKLTLKRYLKIFLESEFYKYTIFIILLIAGYETISAGRLFKLVFNYFMYANEAGSFISSFLMFYMFVPFYNKLIDAMDQKSHAILLGLLLFWYTICGTFFFNSSVFGEAVWFAVVYFIAAYLRLYPAKWTKSKKFGTWLFIGSVLLAWLSVIVVDFIGVKFGFESATYMVESSNRFLAVTTSLGAFLLFLNWDLPYSRFINSTAATVFGVLCIHASSDAMRTFLWKDLLKVPTMYEVSLPLLILHAVASVVGVFTVCSLIDRLRIRFIEPPVMRWVDRFQDKIENKLRSKKAAE
jgi:hypothetical protein